MYPVFKHHAYSLYNHCTVTQNRFGNNGKNHEQHDALHGHMRDAEDVTKINAANK